MTDIDPFPATPHKLGLAVVDSVEWIARLLEAGVPPSSCASGSA